MEEIEEDNNQNEEQFKIEDIEDINPSMMDSIEKMNNATNSRNYQDNQNYISNEINKENLNIYNSSDRNYVIDSNNMVSNSNEFNFNHNNNINDNNDFNFEIENNLENNNLNIKNNNYIDSNNNVDKNNTINDNIKDNNIIKKENIDMEIDKNDNNNFIYDDNINNKVEEGPINLIEFHKNNYVLNEKALNILRSIKEDLIIVSIVGKARTGKSYLMNLLLNNNNSKYPGNGFEISSKLNSCTRGIWLWDTPRQKPNSSSKIIFIDSEGTNSVDLSTKIYDSKIFALIVLISSLFIYNTNGNIDEKSINDLALAAHLSNIVATNTIEDKDLIINELAPKFIWVLRDFILDKFDPETGEEITSNEYLELCLRNKNSKNSMENNLIRENIIKFFKERECITLPRPVDEEKDLHKLNEIPFCKLKPNFREEFLNLKKIIYEKAKIKKIGNKKINGLILVELLISFINSFNSKIIPNINSAIDNIIINEMEKSYENSIKLWKENISRIKENNNEKVKDLYELKYNAMTEFNTVINENKEIKYNNQYLEIFKNNKNKLENEIQNDINKICIIISNKRKSLLNDILNKNNLDNNRKDLIINKENENYLNLINDIKINCNEFDDEKALEVIIDKDIENNNLIKEIKNNINKNYENKINEIEGEIKENELYLKTYDITQFNNINETLNHRFELLNEELDKNQKELFGLIGKYTKLVEKRDKMMSSNIQKRREPNLALLRSQNFQNGFCGITVESNEKGCGCQLGEFCSIF